MMPKKVIGGNGMEGLKAAIYNMTEPLREQMGCLSGETEQRMVLVS